MKEFKGTRGEWKIIHEINVTSKSNRPICACGTYDPREEDCQATNQANAQLIASSPELLKALQAIRNQMTELILDESIELDEGDAEVLNQADEAINKALGE